MMRRWQSCLECIAQCANDSCKPSQRVPAQFLCACMQAFPSGALAFYNSGEASGASQPHKHVQVVPLPLGDSEAESQRLPFGPVIRQAWRESGGAFPDRPVPIKGLPFQNWCCVLPDGCGHVAKQATSQQMVRQSGWVILVYLGRLTRAMLLCLGI